MRDYQTCIQAEYDNSEIIRNNQVKNHNINTDIDIFQKVKSHKKYST